MAQSVKLSDDIMRRVRRESELQSRSIAGQITHWINIGRAIERSERFDYTRLQDVLSGKVETRVLSEEEKEVWKPAFLDRMAKAGEGEEAFFEQRRQLGLGVGLDETGAIVTQTNPDADSQDADTQ